MASNSGSRSLASILIPQLFHAVVEDRLPFDPTKPVDFDGVLSKMSGDFAPGVKESVWEALVVMSKIPTLELPDMMQFLPNPTDPEFARQCLGLQLIFDQGPRQILQGVDERWTSFFDSVVDNLAYAYNSLPEEQKPTSFSRWELTGTHFDYWTLAHFFLTAAFVHGESKQSQNIALNLTEAKRKAVEERVGQTDPNRARRQEILSDTVGFPRVAIEGPPQGPKVTMQEWVFWSCMLLDIHYPIIQEFGRYPYRNAIEGRESTESEKLWVEKTNHFAEADEETAAKIKEDVKHNRWTPLGVQH